MSKAPLSFDEVEERASALAGPKLIAIDGLPLAGKSTLAERLAHRLDAQCLYLDDFVLPQVEWPRDISPAFPFPYIRYGEFVGTVSALAHAGVATYRRYDWARANIAAKLSRMSTDRPVIVEGVSTLNSVLAPLYDLRLWVESDPDTTLAASLARGVGDWELEWRTLFLPSVTAYLRTDPESRADLFVAGRGARQVR